MTFLFILLARCFYLSLKFELMSLAMINKCLFLKILQNDDSVYIYILLIYYTQDSPLTYTRLGASIARTADRNPALDLMSKVVWQYKMLNNSSVQEKFNDYSKFVIGSADSIITF